MPADDITDDTTDRLDAATDPTVTDDTDTRRLQGRPGSGPSDQPTHRLYGAERIAQPTELNDRGLLSLRELRLLEHAERFDDDQQRALETLLEERIDQFAEMEWGVIKEAHPTHAERLREVICDAADE